MAAAETTHLESEEALREKMLRHMYDDEYMAKVKPEFLNIHYKARLVTDYLPGDVKTELEETLANNEKNGVEPAKKKIKLKGRNKQRHRDVRGDRSLQICSAVVAGKKCSFGERCRFTHDIEKYMASKPPDIASVCYLFDTFGKCPYGAACRYGSQHCDSDFNNIINEEIYNPNSQRVCNVLSKDLQVRLRKREVVFQKADKFLSSIGIKPKHGYNQSVYSKNDVTNVKSANSPTSGAIQQSLSSAKTNQAAGDVTVTPSSACEGHYSDDRIPNSTHEPTVTVSESPVVSAQDQIVTGSVIEMNLTKKDPAQTPLTQTEANLFVPAEPPGNLGCVTDEDVIRIRPEEKKKIDFSDKLYLAPLTTVGNLPFRRICKQYGADVTCGEMALVTNLLQGQQSEWALLKRHGSEDLFGVQVCGGHADTMTRCAELLNNNIEVDFIDINVGCPIDLIFNKGEGSALMGRLTRFEQIVKGMTSILDVPLTAKLRTGIYESKFIAHTVLPKLRDWGVSLATLHGRSREQRYTKPADWEYIAECAKIADPMPLFGNGDVMSYEEYNTRREMTGVSGIMLARGALVKPWLFTEIKEQRNWDISSTERFDMMKTYVNYGLEHWGSDNQGVETTRKFLLEWISFLHRYIPYGLLDQGPQKINQRPPRYIGRNDLETLMASENCGDWIKISEMLLGPVPSGFTFLPKHKANSYK